MFWFEFVDVLGCSIDWKPEIRDSICLKRQIGAGKYFHHFRKHPVRDLMAERSILALLYSTLVNKQKQTLK